jgi:hypothetical protein
MVFSEASKESSKPCADDEVCKKPAFSLSPETRHSFDSMGYNTHHFELPRIVISEIPTPRPVVSDAVTAPKPFSGTTDPET